MGIVSITLQVMADVRFNKNYLNLKYHNFIYGYSAMKKDDMLEIDCESTTQSCVALSEQKGNEDLALAIQKLIYQLRERGPLQ